MNAVTMEIFLLIVQTSNSRRFKNSDGIKLLDRLLFRRVRNATTLVTYLTYANVANSTGRIMRLAGNADRRNSLQIRIRLWTVVQNNIYCKRAVIER